MTRRTTSRAAFTREAAEIAAEASEDALARDVARKVLHPPPAPRKRLPKAVWAAHAVAAVGLGTAALGYPASAGPCLLAGGLYACGAALLHGRAAYPSWRAYFRLTDD